LAKAEEKKQHARQVAEKNISNLSGLPVSEDFSNAPVASRDHHRSQVQGQGDSAPRDLD
jgi:hypothetical protein